MFHAHEDIEIESIIRRELIYNAAYKDLNFRVISTRIDHQFPSGILLSKIFFGYFFRKENAVLLVEGRMVSGDQRIIEKIKKRTVRKGEFFIEGLVPVMQSASAIEEPGVPL